MVYKSVRGWTSGQSLPVLNFVKYPQPPPQGCTGSRFVRDLENIAQLSFDGGFKMLLIWFDLIESMQIFSLDVDSSYWKSIRVGI